MIVARAAGEVAADVASKGPAALQRRVELLGLYGLVHWEMPVPEPSRIETGEAEEART